MTNIKKFRIKSFKQNKSILKLEKISISFGRKTILDNLNLSLNSGQILGLLGPNGVGKSTIFNLITGLISPDFGSIIINSKVVNEYPIYKRTIKFKIGFVPHYQDYERCKYLSSDYHLINVVNNNPLEVAREISKCEYILSSSLHGIIAAHAYGIPAAHIVFSKLHGDGTKFLDYYQSVGLEMETSTRIKPKYSCPDKLNLQPIVEIFESLND